MYFSFFLIFRLRNVLVKCIQSFLFLKSKYAMIIKHRPNFLGQSAELDMKFTKNKNIMINNCLIC